MATHRSVSKCVAPHNRSVIARGAQPMALGAATRENTRRSGCFRSRCVASRSKAVRCVAPRRAALRRCPHYGRRGLTGRCTTAIPQIRAVVSTGADRARPALGLRRSPHITRWAMRRVSGLDIRHQLTTSPRPPHEGGRLVGLAQKKVVRDGCPIRAGVGIRNSRFVESLGYWHGGDTIEPAQRIGRRWLGIGRHERHHRVL